MRILATILIGFLLLALWNTRPDAAKEKCMKIADESQCQYLDKE